MDGRKWVRIGPVGDPDFGSEILFGPYFGPWFIPEIYSDQNPYHGPDRVQVQIKIRTGFSREVRLSMPKIEFGRDKKP